MVDPVEINYQLLVLHYNREGQAHVQRPFLLLEIG